MKKLFAALTAVVLMLGGSLTAQAYTVTVSGMQCSCSISGNSVSAQTAYSNQTVVINSTAYDSNDNSIGGSGNSANSYVSVSYNTGTKKIYYAEQTHKAPNIGLSVTRREYA